MFEFIHKMLTVSLKPSFRLSVEIGSRFSELVCFNWVWNEVFTSLILEKNIWTHAKLARVATPSQISSNLKFEISLQTSSYLKILLNSPSNLLKVEISPQISYLKFLLKSPHIWNFSSNLLKFEIFLQISSNLLKKCRFSGNTPQISSN